MIWVSKIYLAASLPAKWRGKKKVFDVISVPTVMIHILCNLLKNWVVQRVADVIFPRPAF